MGFVKINVDKGIAKNRRNGAVAACCRDNKGVYLGSSARVIDDCMDLEPLKRWHIKH